MNLADKARSYAGQTKGYPEGQYVGECLSLVKRCITDAYGFYAPASGVGGARGYWENFPNPLPQYFDKVPRPAIPQRGDIAVWSGAVGGGYGHISIVENADGSGFRSWDQNWPFGVRYTHLQSHNYNNVYGFLRPKGQEDPDMAAVPPEVAKQIILDETGVTYENAGIPIEIPAGTPIQGKELYARCARFNFAQKIKEIQIRDKIIKDYETKIAELSTEIEDLKNSNTFLLSTIDTLKKRIEELENQVPLPQPNPEPIVTPGADFPTFIRDIIQWIKNLFKKGV